MKVEKISSDNSFYVELPTLYWINGEWIPKTEQGEIVELEGFDISLVPPSPRNVGDVILYTYGVPYTDGFLTRIVQTSNLQGVISMIVLSAGKVRRGYEIERMQRDYRLENVVYEVMRDGKPDYITERAIKIVT